MEAIIVILVLCILFGGVITVVVFRCLEQISDEKKKKEDKINDLKR